MNDDIKKQIYLGIAILIVFLVGLNIFFYYLYNENKKDFDSYKQTKETKKVVDKINEPMTVINDREVDLYVKMNADITKINTNIKTMKETLSRLEKNQLTRSQSYDTFKNKDINEISKFLSDNNLTNAIISR